MDVLIQIEKTQRQKRLAEKVARGVVEARPIRGWFLPGCDANHWLNELQRSGIPLRECELAIIATSPSDQSPCGLLVVLPAKSVISTTSTLLGMPLTVADDRRFFIPLDAQLSPALSRQDWQQVLGSAEEAASRRWFWHPGRGLTSLEPLDFFPVSDLLRPPRIVDADWSLAEPGTLFPSRLISVSVSRPPTLQDVFGQEDIGADSQSLQDLISEGSSAGQVAKDLFGLGLMPLRWLWQGVSSLLKEREPEEKAPRKFVERRERAENPIAGSFANAWARFRASLASWFAPRSPVPKQPVVPPGMPKGLNSWEEWAKRMTASLLSKRRRELDRLMEMLEKDPDKGLRFAIPFGALGGLARGLAIPGASLLGGGLDFAFGGGGGGGLVDVWDIPADIQLRMQQRYRELAEREIQLGRFRRAAHIYGKLLGDLGAAANALKLGRYFREAALIYQEKLKRPRDAALCLEEGGLLEEAIPIYLELEEFERVGDLYGRLDRELESISHYQRAAAEKLVKHQPLEAARIHEAKLHDQVAALAILHDAWPDSHQAIACLERELELRGIRGEHVATQHRVRDLAHQDMPSPIRPQFMQVMNKLVQKYPDPGTQAIAADMVAVVASPALLNHDRLSRQVLDQLPLAAKHDRMLERDAQRFQLPKVWSRPEPPAGIAPANRRPIERLHSINMPRGVSWCQLVHAPDYLVAFGTTGHSLTTNMITEKDQFPNLMNWTLANPEPEMVQAEFIAPNFVNVFVRGYGPLRAHQQFGLTVGTWDGISGETLASVCDHHERICTVDAHWTVRYCEKNGVRLLTRPLAPMLSHDGIFFRDVVQMAANPNGVFVGIGQNLLHLQFDRGELQVQTEHGFSFAENDWIRQVVADPQRFRLAVVLDKGVKVTFDSIGRSFQLSATQDESYCHCLFLGTGELVIAGEHHIWVYRLPTSGGPQLIKTLDFRYLVPLALTHGFSPGTVCVLRSQEIIEFRVR